MWICTKESKSGGWSGDSYGGFYPMGLTLRGLTCPTPVLVVLMTEEPLEYEDNSVGSNGRVIISNSVYTVWQPSRIRTGPGKVYLTTVQSRESEDMNTLTKNINVTERKEKEFKTIEVGL